MKCYFLVQDKNVLITLKGKYFQPKIHIKL